jgi:vanillate monooxygenase
MFLRNTWYVAATASEITDKPLGRTICGQALVLFRDAERKVAALEDFCPHRGAPLSIGRVIDGRLVCGYHGLEMGCDGKTVAMPGQRVRGFPPIRAFPVVELYGFVWVWPGEAALADAAKVPALAWAEDAEWAYGGGVYRIACDYRLMIDNLMDLTHETYVHAGSIGQKEIDETAPLTKVEGDEVVVSRHMNNILAPPFWRQALRSNHLPDDQPVDRWQVCRFTPPSQVMIQVGVAMAGHGGFEADAQHKAAGIVVDLLTPETETSMWYFWGLARHFRPHDDALTAEIREGQGKIFVEDVAVLERQQKNLSAQPQRQLLMLNIDLGGVQSRKVLDRLIAAEKAATS